MQTQNDSAYLGGVATDEVVHDLLQGQLAHRRQDTKGITAQQHHVARVGAHTRDARILNVLNGVAGTGVLCDLAAQRNRKQTRADTNSNTHAVNSLVLPTMAAA